jgi:acetyl-CoA acetyltransferase
MDSLCGTTAAAGVGILQYARGAAPYPEREVLIRAIVQACDDAGVDPSEIDGFVSYGDDANEPVRLMSDLGTRELNWSEMIWGGGGGGLASVFASAAAAIQTRQAKVVVIFRSLVQGNSGRLSAAVSQHHLNPYLVGAGIMAPAQNCALRAQRLFEHHRIPHAVAEVLVQVDYYHGSRNPQAVAYRKPLDHETYSKARWIAEPFRLYDCSRENDGAGAIIMVSSEHARDLRSKPVYLLGATYGTHRGSGDLLENDEDYAGAGFRSVADRLWAKTGLKPADIDVVQIYENFAAQGISSLIDHGFCSYESAEEFITFENLIAPSGKLPFNTSGGNLAQGFIHGIGMAVEAVRQLRGESSNPVPGATTCLLAGGPAAPIVSSAVFATEQPNGVR